jgi:putative ABC transport system permease protein
LKEIGIRKVLGASTPGIVGMLSKEFVILVMVAFVVSVPLGMYAMNKWLEGFAYKISPGITVFVVAGIVSFLIAWITVGFESVKAALGNPVKALRSE